MGPKENDVCVAEMFTLYSLAGTTMVKMIPSPVFKYESPCLLNIYYF